MFPASNFPDLLVGLEVSDDAAVYRINDSTAIIHTLDFFTPVVDDPYEYGSIAAANALSDIYAMGGSVLLALNILAFPKEMPLYYISEILKGGGEKVKESGGVLAGGHSIDDKEPKYGLSVMGTVHPEKILTKGAARAGEIIFLTKPLGTGIITTAFKADQAEEKDIADAVSSMKRLNRGAAEILSRFPVKCCTDITGFALLGHLSEIVQKSGCGIRLNSKTLPFLSGARDYAEEWLFPGGSERNKCAFSAGVSINGEVPEELEMLLYTPETSGGLAFTVPREQTDSIAGEFEKMGEPFWIIGETIEGPGIVLS